jgi:small GTP-binding protein
MRSHRLFFALSLAIALLAMAAWLVVSVTDMHDRLARISPRLALGFAGVAVLAIFVFSVAAARFFWKLGRAERPPPRAPADLVHAAEAQTESAAKIIEQVRDEEARGRLNGALAELRADKERRRFHVVVFGTGSAGKTSLINALLGHPVGKTEAPMGTTRHVEPHTHTVEGVDGTLILTDTPGLSEIGAGGAEREAMARDLAARADLLLFVVDHDLIRTEYDLLVALARQGKRSIVVLNKADWFTDHDRTLILAKLRERLAGIVPPADIVTIAAAPRPMQVRFKHPDGREDTVLEPQPPDLDQLERRIEAILKREGDVLRAGNLLLRAHMLSKQAQDAVSRQRRAQASAIIDRYQWVTAGAVFANPIPAFDLMATGAVQFQMISEMAAVYGVELSAAHVRLVGGQMIQLLLKLGLVEAATSLIAGVFKSTLVGYAAGGAVQAVTMAYLTHVSGQTFAEYFERGQSWGDGGMQAALVRQFDLNSRAEFLQEFARQALERVVKRLGKNTPAGA